MTKWDDRFIKMSHECASWSKDPNTQVGSIAIDPLSRNILATGYNGLPRGVADDERLFVKDVKLGMVVHAEANIVAAAARKVLLGSTAYVTRHPCGQCAALLIQAGVSRIVYVKHVDFESRWADSVGIAKSILLEAGVVLDRA